MIDFYSKKSLPWHGGLLYTRYTATEQEEAENCQHEAQTGSRGKYNLLEYHITYFDCILSGDSKQNYVAIMPAVTAKAIYYWGYTELDKLVELKSCRNNVITSTQLVINLKANGGIANLFAEMIGINRSHAQ
eukprot:4230984-Ditylum_brightwellii.AAC.1